MKQGKRQLKGRRTKFKTGVGCASFIPILMLLILNLFEFVGLGEEGKAQNARAQLLIL